MTTPAHWPSGIVSFLSTRATLPGANVVVGIEEVAAETTATTLQLVNGRLFRAHAGISPSCHVVVRGDTPALMRWMLGEADLLSLNNVTFEGDPIAMACFVGCLPIAPDMSNARD